MKKNIKSSEVPSLIKQMKQNISDKYTQISKQNAKVLPPKPKNTIKTIELLFNLKNKSEQPSIPQQFPSYQAKNQLKKKQTLNNQKSNNNSNLIAYKPKTLETNFQIEKRNTIVAKQVPKIIIENNKQNNQIAAKPSLVINGLPKPISKPVVKLPINKQPIVIDLLEIKKEEKDKIISEYSSKIQAKQPQEFYLQPSTEVEVKSDLKKKDGSFFIKLQIKNLHEQNFKLNQLHNQIKESPNQKINLRLDTYFESYQSLLSFCTKFLKFGVEITYLTWNVKGYFEDDGDSNNIGELVSRFQNLYRFEFNIYQSSLSNSAALSFSNGLKKLTQLQVLRINIYDSYRGVLKDILRRANQYLVQAIQSLPNLQIMTSKNKQIQFCSPLPPKMGNFIYNYNCSTNQDGYPTSKRQDVDFQKQSKLITHVTIRNNASEYTYNKQQSMKDTIKIFDLPYVTRLESLKDNRNHQGEVPQVIALLRKLTFTKMRNLLQILCFKKVAQEFLPINPVMVMTDLWID